MKLSGSEWAIMDILWTGEQFALKDITGALVEINGWSRNTVHTYLKRMEAKGLVSIEKGSQKPYSAAVSKEECAKEERQELLSKVYDGSAGDLLVAFLKESHISAKERDRLRKLLDEMEV